jgi:uncharacterized protein DUF6660
VKIIALILSSYILVLNFAPCEDNGTVDNEIKIELSQNVDVEQGHTFLNLCSPFCQCDCCHVHSVDFGINEIEPLVAAISLETFTHFDNLGKVIINPILQPPRI